MARLAYLSTKAKREALARELEAIAVENGAEFACKPCPLDPKSLRVAITNGPYTVHIDLDGSSQVGALMGHWVARNGARFPEWFGRVAGSINTYHFHKATTCEDSPGLFKGTIGHCLYDIANRFPVAAE